MIGAEMCSDPMVRGILGAVGVVAIGLIAGLLLVLVGGVVTGALLTIGGWIQGFPLIALATGCAVVAAPFFLMPFTLRRLAAVEAGILAVSWAVTEIRSRMVPKPRGRHRA